MIPLKAIHDEETDCDECGEHLVLDVYESGGGFYVGFWCPNCGPYSRESRYFEKRRYAEKHLEWLVGAW